MLAMQAAKEGIRPYWSFILEQLGLRSVESRCGEMSQPVTDLQVPRPKWPLGRSMAFRASERFLQS